MANVQTDEPKPLLLWPGVVAVVLQWPARFWRSDLRAWNHPVLVGDVLLVRNDQEMVAFRLSLAGG